ncbi:MAG: hypothetical protein KF852_19755 [Saprospiraceae bacterium]|nr:hypothetical protein [Saprospiraceae bacterium]
MFRKITLLTALCAIIGGRATAQYCADNPDNNSTFDWTASGWYLYIKPNDNSPGQLNYLASPYHPNTSNTQPNTSHIEAATGLGDYHPADGWVLINELMGLTDSQSVVFPQFVLYNRFESKLRYFAYVADKNDVDQIKLRIKFIKPLGYTHVSAALEHAFTPMDVVENYQDKKIAIEVPNGKMFAKGGIK